MSDENENLSEYERLTREYARVAGPEDAYGKIIQDSIEIKDFLNSKAGAIMVGGALEKSRAALQVILDPNLNMRSVLAGVYELRVQHRLLQQISSTINQGKLAHQQILIEDEHLTTESVNEHPG